MTCIIYSADYTRQLEMGVFYKQHKEEIPHILNRYAMVVAVLVFITVLETVVAESLAQTKHLEKFVDELPSMPKLQGYKKYNATYSTSTLTIGMYQIEWKFHRDLAPTTVFAYGTDAKKATVPGPTIEAKAGVATYINWENHLPQTHLFHLDETLRLAKPRNGGVPTVVHVHGGMNDPESDGHPYGWFTSAFTEKGEMWKKQVYHYPNIQPPGNLWYHDHAMGFTRVNILAGLFGAYVIRDATIEEDLNLPRGKEYDRHLLVSDRSFYANGSIYFPSVGDNPHVHPEWQPEYFGDVIVVNGKAWPYLKVRRRKYRFRIVNTSNARFYKLALTPGHVFTQIGSDASYLDEPVDVRSILLAPSEQSDVIIDFKNSPGKEVLLTNSAAYPYPSGDAVNSQNSVVMKFIVDGNVHEKENSGIPRKLIPIERLRHKDVVKSRIVTLLEYESRTGEPTHLLLNGLTFDFPATETPREGTTEQWYIVNLTDDNHPVHMHLVSFQVMNEQMLTHTEKLISCLQKSYSPDKCGLWNYVTGKSFAPSPNEAGWKNVYKMKPAHITSFLIRFSNLNRVPFPFNASAEPGYVYHCHILDHEDNEMMRPLKVLS